MSENAKLFWGWLAFSLLFSWLSTALIMGRMIP